MFLIKTMTKFTNVIGYHKPADLIVYASCLLLDGVIGQIKGQLTRYAYGSGQNASFARFYLTFRRVNCCFLFFMKTYVLFYENRCLVSFSNSVIVLMNW